MEVLAAVSSWVISSACNVQVGGNHWLRSMCGPGNQSIAALMSKLSEQAEVHFPGESTYKGATDRWSTLKAPNPTFVVVPATENDVAESVKFANSLTLPYLAVNSGHGAIITQGRMKYGMEIWMDKLKTIKINPDGKTATIGGGARSKAVTDTLWAAKKQTVTGGCECTSILGPGLGGGHGFLQGRHGLIADQFVSMNIVNADGELKTVSQKSDPDMWWALQGAGHSFAIVTSVTSKIYNITHFDWAYQSFMFTGDKVKGLYQNINDYLLKNGSQSVDMMNYSFFFSNPAVDPNKPVIMFFILQEGVRTVDAAYVRPFMDLGAIRADSGAGSYIDLPKWTGNAIDSPPCQKAGLANIRFPIDLDIYNVQAQQDVYDLFAKTTKETPALNGSMLLFEGYSTQGVKAVDSKSTAFPFRSDNLLVSPVIIYKEDGAALGEKAAVLGESLRQILHRGNGRAYMHTYVNYAYGGETVENWYGAENWRQTKLKALKKKYDPHGRFNFYAPIA